MATAHELPDLPSLAPLEVSPNQDPSTPGPVKPAMLKTKDSSHFLKSPALSFAESFSTAYTSPSPRDDLSQLDLSSQAPPQSLRKSVSVDSFAHYGREGVRNNSSGYSPVSPEIERTAPIDAQITVDPSSSRHRGESFSSVHNDNDIEGDDNRSESIASPSASPSTERFRTKSQDSFTSLIRGGHLPLPSRSRDSGSLSTFNTSNHRERESLPSISSSSSLQSSSKRASVYATSGRVRSGSLGYNPPNFSKRTVINPHIPPQPVRSLASNGSKDIVLAVIGTTGCGKSTVIRKGLSGYGLMEPRVIQEASNASGLPRYIRRTGNVMLDLPASPGGTPQVFEVIEVQVQTTSSGRLKWPQGLPPIDGLIICYDCSNKSSYQPVEGLLKGYRSMILPIMVLGCKADLEHEIDPSDASLMLKEYDTGLIEVSNTSDGGKEKIKRSFEYLLKAILRQRGPNRFIDSRNPASPDLPSKGAPWGESWTHSPTASSLIPTSEEPSSAATNTTIPESSELSGSTTNEDSPTTTSPDWQPSTRNLPEQSNPTSQLPVNEQNIKMADQQPTLPQSEPIDNSSGLPDEVIDQVPEEKKVKKEPRPSQWADLDDLLDKLLFLAVSGDDPTFATHFLLTHRRFATPRSVLLAMQKRMRQLDNPCGDPMFACFAQMRICNLLETWIRDYPYDFAVKGTAGALNALIKSIISKTHLMHYGTEFLPFLEQLPGLVDQDAAWALKVDVSDNDSDVYTPEDEDDDDTKTDKSSQSSATTNSPQTSSNSPKLAFPSRERKSSLPLPKSLLSPAPTNGSHRTIYDQSPKQHIRDLTKLALEVMHTDSEAIAQEITRQGVRRFLMIKARDWLHYTFVHGKSQSIIEFNIMSNHLADWVVSLILCHERPNKRARQIEKFVDIAQRLRTMNNYSALRAFVAGINNANDDPTMEAFKSKSPDAAKNLMSWDVLLQQIRSHRSYRLALRNSKGACIPALEVHMSDLIKAHEGNDDKNPEFPTKIPWGKFNMMGRFINNTLQCQTQCRNSNNYEGFPENSTVAELFVKCPTMSIEMQKSRLKSQDYDYDDFHATIPISQPKDITGLRKIFFW